jgi:hypothetical protein
MDTTHLFVTFWTICLGNLPEGNFTHRRISSADARLRIDDARKRKALSCLSDDDLLAPYRKQELDDHRALCRVLKAHHGIDLPLKDFFTRSDGSDALYFTNTLACMTLTSSNALLVISCSYSFPEKKSEGMPALEIAPASVEFHLIASCE